MKSKKLLIITYYFPPSGGSGVLRIVRLLGNIRPLGWRPYVLTIDARDLDKIAYGTINRDESFAGIERDLEILRVRSYRPSYVLSMFGRPVKRAFVAARSRFRRAPGDRPRAAAPVGRGASGGPPPECVAPPGASSGKALASLSGRAGRFFIDSIMITDQLLEWTVPAVSRGIPFVRRNDLPYLFSSSPPWSAHLIALLLKRLCRKKWIMDLRDPIYGIAGDGRKSRSSMLVESFNRSLERLLIRNADVVVCNCEEIREYYRRRYGKTRFEVIMNSFDRSDFPPDVERRERTDKITIRYVGELYETIRTPDAFLTAAAELLREEPALRNRLSIAFTGDRRYVHLPAFRDLCAALDLGTNVQAEGYVPHRDAITKMLDADALLLLQPHESTRYQIPAKLFEYIAAGNPIIAIAPAGSATFNIIERHGLGAVNDPGDTAGIKRSIRDAIAGNVPRPSQAAVEEFSAERMTEKLVDILESLQ